MKDLGLEPCQCLQKPASSVPPDDGCNSKRKSQCPWLLRLFGAERTSNMLICMCVFICVSIYVSVCVGVCGMGGCVVCVCVHVCIVCELQQGFCPLSAGPGFQSLLAD